MPSKNGGLRAAVFLLVSYINSSLCLGTVQALLIFCASPSAVLRSICRALCGHSFTQRMQVIHLSPSVFAGSLFKIACTGQRAAHRPQRLHRSVVCWG